MICYVKQEGTKLPYMSSHWHTSPKKFTNQRNSQCQSTRSLCW